MRYLKPGFFSNELLAECEPLARILFEGLWLIADREGRLEDRPKRIEAEILPYDRCNIDALLRQLAQREFITRYKVSGKSYIQIANFQRHQKPHPKEPPSTIPAAPVLTLTPYPAEPEKETAEPHPVTVEPEIKTAEPAINFNSDFNGNGNMGSLSGTADGADATGEVLAVPVVIATPDPDPPPDPPPDPELDAYQQRDALLDYLRNKQGGGALPARSANRAAALWLVRFSGFSLADIERCLDELWDQPWRNKVDWLIVKGEIAQFYARQEVKEHGEKSRNTRRLETTAERWAREDAEDRANNPQITPGSRQLGTG